MTTVTFCSFLFRSPPFGRGYRRGTQATIAPAPVVDPGWQWSTLAGTYEVLTSSWHRGTIRAAFLAPSHTGSNHGERKGSPSPLVGEGGFPRFALRKSDLEIRVRGTPPGDRAVSSRSRPRRGARNGSLAGAARIGDGRARRPAGYPSPGFAKLAVVTPRCWAAAEVCSPSETALSHKGRGGASSCAADPIAASQPTAKTCSYPGGMR